MNRARERGFSGGEKKRNEILQMAVLEPKLAILDETDSGLDIDALRVVADGVNALRSPETARSLLVTHYQRLLNYIVPDFVHVLVDGRIVRVRRQGARARARGEGLRGWIEARRRRAMTARCARTSTRASDVDRFLAERARATPRRAPRGSTRSASGALARFAELGFPTAAHEDWQYTNVAPIAAASCSRRATVAARARTSPACCPRPASAAASARLVFVERRASRPVSSARSRLPAGRRRREPRSPTRAHAGSLARAHARDGRAGRRTTRSPRSTPRSSTTARSSTSRDGCAARRADPARLPDASAPSAVARASAHADRRRRRAARRRRRDATSAAGTAPYVTNAVDGDRRSARTRAVDARPHRSARATRRSTSRRRRGAQARDSRFASHVGRARRRALAQRDSRRRARRRGRGAARSTGSTSRDGDAARRPPHARSTTPRRTARAASSTRACSTAARRRLQRQGHRARRTRRRPTRSRRTRTCCSRTTRTVDTKPELEIFADDVKCAHGATVGQLDDERALLPASARHRRGEARRRLLVHAFASEIDRARRRSRRCARGSSGCSPTRLAAAARRSASMKARSRRPARGGSSEPRLRRRARPRATSRSSHQRCTASRSSISTTPRRRRSRRR